jgi:hypothetical protein
MKILRITQILGLASLMLLFMQCDEEIYLPDQDAAAKSSKAVKAPSGETAGNNLSYPVLWADDVEKPLPGTMGEYSLTGEWWYVWGEDPYDPQQPLYSCEPDPDNPDVCVGGDLPGDGTSVVYKAYVQKDVNNTWQAFNATPIGRVDIDLIDWGDDLESVDFSINSMVRAEVVLFEYLDDEVYVDKTLPQYPQYPMRHVFGWGSNEVHGFQTDGVDSEGKPIPYYDAVIPPAEEDYLATVYSHNARFTIQKLNVDNLDNLGELTWIPGAGWTGNDINPPFFNMAVYQAGDGPGYYNAEINVKGKVIYGYTWKVRTLNEGEGYYRLTFSFDEDGPGAATLNTFIDEDTKFVEDLVPTTLTEGEEERGGTPKTVIVDGKGITYMDILITPKTKGGGGNNGKDGGGGNGSPGGGKGRH